MCVMWAIKRVKPIDVEGYVIIFGISTVYNLNW